MSNLTPPLVGSERGKAMKYAIMVLALVGVLARPTAAIGELTGNQVLEICKGHEFKCGVYVAG